MDVDEDAVQQLVDLGIPRKQAFIALQKYNNDVMRAADYIFSGHADQDLVDHPLELPGAALPDAESAELTQASENVTSYQVPEIVVNTTIDVVDANPATISDTQSPSTEPVEAFDDQAALDKWHTADAVAFEDDDLLPTRIISPVEPTSMEPTDPTYATNYDIHQWSLVPYQNNQQNFSAENGNDSEDHYSYYNLTWWRDPLPIYRRRVINLPVGLRPPPYDFSCSPPLIQSLYHIPLFRTAILSQKPTPSDWGSTENYWKGTGRAIPEESKSIIESQPPPYEEAIDNDLNAEMDKMSVNSITPDSANSYDSDDLEGNNFLANTEGNRILAAKSAANLKVVHELQRLFAFLLYTNRRYVSVKNVVRAIQASGNIDGTELTNARPEGLLDQLITCTGFDNTFEKSFELADGSSFNASSLFTISAVIEMFVDDKIQEDTEQETAFFLVISPDETTFDFHGCLRPLIYEDNDDSDSDMGNEIMGDQNSDSDERSKTCKITSFTQVPPILHIFLEDPNQYSIGVHTAAGGRHNQYKVEKYIYMDRYLHSNRDKVLKINQEIRNAKAKVTKTKEKLNYYNRNCNSHTAMEYLEHALCYFDSKDPSNENDAVEKVLKRVRQDIENGNKELEEAEHNLHSLSEAMFTCTGLLQCKYTLHAILMHDGGNGTGHHWAYINMETSGIPSQEDGKTWFRCCDALVVPCTEEEAFDDEALVYSLIYINADTEALNIPSIGDIIPPGLKAHVMEDCNAFEEELQAMHNVEINFDDQIHGSDDEEDEEVDDNDDDDGDDDDDDTASVPLESSPDLVENDNDTQKSEWVEEYLLSIQQEASKIPSDNYRTIESYEIFLAKFGEISALRYLLETFGCAFNNLSPEDAEQTLRSMKHDPKLEWQYQLYQDYVTIAEIICQAVEMIMQQQDETALKYLVIAKEQTVKWKEHLWRRNHTHNIDALFDGSSFLFTIQKLGKHVLSSSNAKAYVKATNEAYRKRGFEDAIRISKYAQALLDPDSLEHDPFYNRLQEQWLSFTDTITGSLDEEQAELFNSLVMSFLEYQGVDSRDLEITGQQQDSTEDLNLRQPTWERYRDCMDKVYQILVSQS